MRIEKRHLVSFAASMIGLLVIVFIVCQRSRLPAVPTWHGIIPGKTTRSQVVSKLGYPDVYEHNEECVKMHYFDRDIEGWSVFDIFMRKKEDGESVVGIYLLLPTFEKTRNYPELLRTQNLGLYVQQYGKPEKVDMSSTAYFRYLIWSTDGIMVEAEARPPLLDIDSLYVSTIFIFEPQEIDMFLSNIPCNSLIKVVYLPGFPPAGEEDRDPLPEDPYNWDTMPTPSLTEQP